MDLAPYLELRIAPRAIFDALPERATRVRFMLPDGDDWRSVTNLAFARMIRRAALFLAHAEAKSQDRAAIFAGNSVEWIASALAIQAAGGVMVPIYPASTPEQAAYVARHSDARVLFVSPELFPRVLERWSEYDGVYRFVSLGEVDLEAALGKVREKGVAAPPYADVERRLVSWSRAQTLGAARDAERPGEFEQTMAQVSLEQPALMLYTSGTSGNPKGVPLTHRNIAANGLDWMKCNAPLLDEGAVDLLWLPMSHIFGLGEACIGNALGWTTYLADPLTVMQKLPEVKPAVFMSVPSVWEKLAIAAKGEPEKLRALTGGKLKFCLSGGAGLKREVKELFHANGILIIEGYGLTETSPTLTLNRPDAFRFDTVGRALPSVELKLAEDGEILARGPNVFAGYHKDAAATREAFTADGWFKTGDVGRLTDDGFLQIVDRKKDILVTAGGKNVPPANIEQRFADDPFIGHVVVYGDGQRYLTAGVWLNGAAVDAHLAKQGVARTRETVDVLVQQRIDRVNSQLASFESIKKFVVIDRPLTVNDGLLTATLKVRRKKVYETFKREFEALYAPTPLSPDGERARVRGAHG